MSSSVCAKGLDFSNHFFAPELFAHKSKCAVSCYDNHPILTRLVAVPSATVLGLIKPLLFPLWAAVGAVVLPIIAAVRAYKGSESGFLLVTWAFTLLGLAGVISYVLITVYSLTLLEAIVVLVAAITVSLAIHVYRACSHPKQLYGSELKRPLHI